MTAIVLDNPKIEQDIPIAVLHADPVQPRVHPDADLAASIKSQGVLEAITIEPITPDSIPDTDCEDCGRSFHQLAAEGGHFLILNGERRYRGTIAAGRKTILGKVVPPSTEGARLLRQLTSNTGKPLTPVEEAFAFQRLMEAQGWSQAELARQLGRPRSVIGDRIRLVELHQAWLDLIAKGKLQFSHAPIIHQYLSVPDEYQVKAAAKIASNEGWQMRKYENEEDVIPVSAFRDVMSEAFRDYIIRLDQVRSYKGPVLEIEERMWHGAPARKVKYAADITLWRPIKHAAEKRAKKARQSSSSGYAGGQRYESDFSKALKSLKAAGLEPPKRKVGARRAEPKDGEAVVFTSSGWARGLHPKVLLEKIDPASLVLVDGQYGGDEIISSDSDAVAASQEAYRKHAADVSKKELAPLRAKLTPAVLAKYAVSGPGVPHLLMTIDPMRGAPKVIALAIGLAINGAIDEDDVDEDDAVLANDSLFDAEKLLSAIAAVGALDLKVPDEWAITRKINTGLDVAFKIDKARIKAAAKRAAGHQVGGPDRVPKNVDVGEIRAAVEAGEALDEEDDYEIVEEEETEEAFA
jgi:ParB/RepB/Spo0J family partition protein